MPNRAVGLGGNSSQVLTIRLSKVAETQSKILVGVIRDDEMKPAVSHSKITNLSKWE